MGGRKIFGKGKYYFSEEKEKEENTLRRKIFCPWMRRKKRRRKGRRKIFGQGRGRGTEEEKEENILEKESDDGQTNTQNFYCQIDSVEGVQQNIMFF